MDSAITSVPTDLSVLHALGVGAAGRGLARVRPGHAALGLQTDQPMRGEMTQCQPMAAHLAHVARVSWAVWVPHTLWAAASDGVRLGHQPGLAPADGVT